MQAVPPLTIPGTDVRVLLFQAGIGAAYAVAMFGVDWMFRRPWVRALAIIWSIWWIAYLLSVPFAANGVALAPEFVLGAVVGPLPLLCWAVDEMNGGFSYPRPRTWPLVIRSLAWTAVAWVVIQLIARTTPNGATLALFTRRLFLALGFLAAAVLVATSRRKSRPSRTPAILLSLCLALFGIRVLGIGVLLLTSHGAPSEAVSYVMPGLIIFQTTISGLLGLLATLVGERRALQMQQARALEAERQAAHADRLESLGRLAGGVAHDFNNVLTVIDSCADLALESSDAPVLVREELDELRRASTRGRELTRQLLAYSRRDHPVDATFAPDERTRSVAAMLRRLLGQEIRLVLEMDDAIDCISMDPSQFEQVVMNLILNARDAMPRGGAITIALHTNDLPAPRTVITGILAQGRYVSVSVRDEGVGIPADRTSRIFDPFYSTKGPDRGTGLGLATVHAIVMRTGGGIDVTSVVGHGTTFCVFLPASIAIQPSSTSSEQLESEQNGHNAIALRSG